MQNNSDSELNAVKKRLVLNDDAAGLLVEENHEVLEGSHKVTTIIEEEVRDIMAPKTSANDDLETTAAVHKCELAVDRVDNIVAIGTIIQVNVASSDQLIHGVPLGNENMRVSIVRAIVDDALLPIPVKDEIVTVSDAIGTCVAWPRNLVVIPGEKAPPKAIQQKKKNRANTKKRMRNVFDDNEDLENLPPNLPTTLKDLCTWGNNFLRDRVTIHTTFAADLFGRSKKVCLLRSDLYTMANKLEVSNHVLVFYMSYLHEVLKKCKMVDMVAFVDPDQTGTLGCGNPTERARSLSDCYRQGRLGQIFVVPHNSGAHRMLTVVNPNEEVVHFMDPLKRRLDTGEWKSIVNNSIKIYNAHKNQKGRKVIQWKNLAMSRLNFL
ncbi:uncharacterized protein LOC112180636 [Rosa chinensis]|uniref:uncharacterized protein LOC112180636 n=1 Tax=Rosa chinensis TaxID=74649 RepID=UPI001AD92F6A|nr:uncharacterized protein LOC112180636 [Rosa chinensis]